MNRSSTFKAVVFDAYGTLFAIATIDQQLSLHFGNKKTGIARVWRQKQLEYTWLRTLMDQYLDFYSITADALQFACDEAGVSLGEEAAKGLMGAYKKLEVYPEVKGALAQLKEKYRLAILSNANPDLLKAAVQHNGIDHYLDAVCSAHSLKKFKPVPAVYQLPEKALEVLKEQILFVSSNPWDIAGAASYGLKTVWVRRSDRPMDKLGPAPDFTVSNLQELAELF